MRRFSMIGCVVALGWMASISARADVLICGSPGGGQPWADDVKNQIASTGRVPGNIDLFNINTGTPTLQQLQNYDAVMVYTDAGAADPVGLGNVVADYCDGGGGVVQCTFSWHVSIPMSGRWQTGGYSPLTYLAQSGGNLTIGTRHAPNHPVLDSVATFAGGNSSYHNNGTYANNAIKIADWSNNAPLVAEMPGFAGRIVGLNFYPPSSDVRDDFWTASTDGEFLLANALSFVSGGGRCQYTVKSAKGKGGCQTCPSKGENFGTDSPCEEVEDCRKKVKTTISCPGGPGTCKVKGKRSSCG